VDETDDIEQDALIRLGVQANLARLYAGDQRGFIEDIAAMLETALPGSTEIRQRGGLFAEKSISGITVDIEGYLYSLDIPSKGAIAAARTRVVRGIKLKTETLPVEEWVSLIVDHVAQVAERNLQARNALQQLLGEK
jgi:hypothetical protein